MIWEPQGCLCMGPRGSSYLIGVMSFATWVWTIMMIAYNTYKKSVELATMERCHDLITNDLEECLVNLPKVYAVVYCLPLISLVLLIFFCILMLIGLRKKKPALLLPYLLSHGTGIVCSLIGAIIFLKGTLEERNLKEFFVVLLVLTLIFFWMTYCLLVVRTCYLQMTRSAAKGEIITIFSNLHAQENERKSGVQMVKIPI